MKRLTFLLIFILALFTRIDAQKLISKVAHPKWADAACIYEVNIRQFTKEGTINSFQNHLPRLKKMGVDILWLMPVNPIGAKNRKGSLGSYYSIQDYKAVNPEFGTMQDFKNLVKEIHRSEMFVIIDWVANHSAWDNSLIIEHPDWYTTDASGQMMSPFDWTDVADFNYSKPDLQNYMIEAMKFWLTETGIDGFRCDVAGMVPTEFWNKASAELQLVKPDLFMLAEAEQPDLLEKAFNMDYAWNLHHLMNKVVKGEKKALDIAKYLTSDSIFVDNSFKMNFITNHDENSWNGSEYERLKTAVPTFAALTAIVPGMMLIYSGQESAFDRRLKFFDKDSVSWGTFSQSGFYQKLNELKNTNRALWGGNKSSKVKLLKCNKSENILAFERENETNKVLVIMNLSPEAVKVTFEEQALIDVFTDFFTGKSVQLSAKESFKLKPWEYKIYWK